MKPTSLMPVLSWTIQIQARLYLLHRLVIVRLFPPLVLFL